MKVTRDFTHGTFSAKKGKDLTQRQMEDLGSDTLAHLRDIAGVISGTIPKGLPTAGSATQAGAITADENAAAPAPPPPAPPPPSPPPPGK